MSDDENYDVEMEEEEEDAAYDSDYCYESDGGGNDDDGEMVTSSSTARQSSSGQKETNQFHVIMDPQKETTEEWRAIYSQLRTLILKSSRRINYEWDSTHEENFRTAILYVQSFRERSCFYPFRLNFYATKELAFPEIAPQIQPLFSLPAITYVMIYKHPLLTTRHWNPCQDLTIMLEFIVSMLDQQITNLETLLLSPPIAGGSLNSLIRSAEEANKWVEEAPKKLSVEQMVAFLYGYYLFEIPYHPELLNQYITGEHVLTACPLNIKKELPKYSGIGYSRDTYHTQGKKDTANTVQQSQSAVQKVMTILRDKFEFFLTATDHLLRNLPSPPITPTDPIDFENNFSKELMERFAFWLYESPLLYILHRNVEQMASGDVVRESENSMLHFDLVLQLELIYQKGLISLQSISSSFSTFQLDDNSQHLFEEIYRKLYRWNKLDLFSEENQIQWFLNMKEKSSIYKMIEIQELTQPSSTSPMKLSSSSMEVSNSDTNPQKLLKIERNQVIYVSGLEKHHVLYSAASAEKCNKFFLKELKTLNEALPEEITIFVAEEHPNYLMGVFYINNQDCPYYGGMFIFHIMIPSNYPESSPKVQFMTTGYGSVRFNPNLYNSGKVCLSLLGTWAGEPWNPKTSNLNQVLSSILFLIFTEEPYYNEPGYDRDGRKYVRESLAYDGTVIANMISYGILDHLIKPNIIPEIAQHIRNYFDMNWSIIEPILQKKLIFHRDEKTLHRTYESIQTDMQNISKSLIGGKK